MSIQQVANYDFRMSFFRPSNGEEVDYLLLGECLYGIAKHFVFQKEEGAGDTNYIHYQGRFSLFKKATKKACLNLFSKKLGYDLCDCPQYLEPTTSVEVKKRSFSYVMKEQGRLDGPWTEKEFNKIANDPEFVPWHLAKIIDKFRSFQKYIYEHRADKDPRIVNVLYNPTGNIGKSDLCDYLRIFCGGFIIPPVSDFQTMVASVMNYAESKQTRDITPIMVDMPRAMPKNKLSEFYAAIEQIKRGRLYDTRYHYKEYNINPPVIWIFTNELPDMTLLSADMWKLWTVDVDNDYELIEYKPIDLHSPLLPVKKTIKVNKKLSD